MLKHGNMRWRLHAQRLLVERGKKDVVPALCKLVEATGVDEVGLNPGAIHALWTLHGLGTLDGAKSAKRGAEENASDAARRASEGALKHPSAGVRRNAVLVLPAAQECAEAIIAAKLLNDEDAQVRLAALLALAGMPVDCDAGADLAALLDSADVMEDRWLREGLTAAAAT